MAANSSDEPVLEELDRAECMKLLAGGTIGRVAFDDGEGPTVIPVNYAVEGDSVIFRTSASGRLNRNLLSAVTGGEVRAAFEVDRFEEAHHEGWSVLLRGGAHPLRGGEGRGRAGPAVAGRRPGGVVPAGGGERHRPPPAPRLSRP